MAQRAGGGFHSNRAAAAPRPTSPAPRAAGGGPHADARAAGGRAGGGGGKPVHLVDTERSSEHRRAPQLTRMDAHMSAQVSAITRLSPSSPAKRLAGAGSLFVLGFAGTFKASR